MSYANQMTVTEDKTDRKLGKRGYQHARARGFQATWKPRENTRLILLWGLTDTPQNGPLSLNGCFFAFLSFSQLTALLQECIELLTTALDIVKLDAKVVGHEGASDAGLLSHCAAIKSAAVLCTQRYVELKNAQYLAFVCKNPKQASQFYHK